MLEPTHYPVFMGEFIKEEKIMKKSCTRETLTLSTNADNSIVSKN